MTREWMLAGCLALIAIGSPAPAPSGPVAVLYAGSLVTPMEGPVKAALTQRGIDFQGEAGGSQMLANLIAGGAKNPDAFIAVGRDVMARLAGKTAGVTVFATTDLGIGWSNRSRFASTLGRLESGRISMLSALQTPGLAIGRTDPRLDPKGRYTVTAVHRLAGDAAESILGGDANPAQTFPEEDLLARVETGQADVGFFYRVEARARGFHFVAMPSPAATTATYSIAVLRDAPHPAAAAYFRDFILRGAGRTILTQAGLQYSSPTLNDDPAGSGSPHPRR